MSARWARIARADGPWALLAAAGLVALAFAPSYSGAYNLDLLYTLLTFAALAQAWNIIGGFGGQFSLGHAAFFGAGAYTTGVLLVHTGVPFLPALVFAGLLSAAGAAVLGIALFRLRGVYFSIGSLAVALAAVLWMLNWTYTGASSGLNLPIEDLPTPNELYYAALVLVVVASLVAASLPRTRFGLKLLAVRDDEDAATTVGVAGGRVKVAAFAASALLTAPVGGLYAAHQISIEPNSAFGLGWTIDMIVMTIIGGIGTTAGPLLGAFVVYYGIEKQLEGYANVSAILTGALLVAVVRFAPEGLWGLLIGVVRRLLRARFRLREALAQTSSV